MHIAAAFRQKIIVIWGNTVPEFGMYPYLPAEQHFYSIEQKLDCRPCSKIGYSSCPKGHFKCMQLQDIDVLAASVRALLPPVS
jgi:ADP-heptose:LPS heptosyltransferase